MGVHLGRFEPLLARSDRNEERRDATVDIRRRSTPLPALREAFEVLKMRRR